MTHKTYTGNEAIARGYQIYDEWKRDKCNSRNVSNYAKGVLDLLYAKGNESARLEVLACVFALDMRIKETYRTHLRRLFSCFSWRREVRALKLLRGELGIPSTEKNIHTAIELVLQQLYVRCKAQGAEEDDDEVHGGRQTEAEGQTVIAEGKQQEKTTQEKAPDEDLQSSDTEQSEEAPEENVQELFEQAQAQEQTVNADNQMGAADAKRIEIEAVVQYNEQKAESGQKKDVPGDHTNQKEEKNGTDTNAESCTDKKTEPKAYNDAFDLPPLYKETAHKQSDVEKVSFIDEVIMDNMIKGKADYLTHNPLEDVKRENETKERANELNRGDEEHRDADKDAHLYNEMLNLDNSAEQAPNDDIDLNAEEIKELRALLQSDVSLELDNEKRKEIGNNMSEEQMVKIYHLQAAEMKEQLELAGAEFGINAPVKIIGKPKLQPTDKTVIISKKT